MLNKKNLKEQDRLRADPVQYGELFKKSAHGLGPLGGSIPPFQRNYAWERKHIKKFIKSINNEDAGLYIGNILIRESRGNKPDIIIDGQQRLITLSLVLLELKQHLLRNRTDIDAILFSKEDRFPRIRFSRDNLENVYAQILKETDPKDLRLDESTKKFLRNVRVIRKEIEPIEDKKLFLRKIQALTLIVIKIPLNYNPNSLFEGLNATGKALTTVELTKNSLFGQFGNNEEILEEASKIWEEIEGSFEKTNKTWFDSFLRYDSFTRYHHVTNSALFEKISNELNSFSPEETLQFIGQLKIDSILYLGLRDGVSSGSEGVNFKGMSKDAASSLTRLVEVIRNFGFPQVYIVLLALYKYGRKNHSYFTKDFLFRDVRSVFSFIVLAKYSGLIPSTYEKLFANFAGDIHSLDESKTFGSVKSTFFSSLQNLIPQSKQESFVSALIEDIYCTGESEDANKLTSRNDRNFLGILLRMINSEDVSLSGTIEHIVPRSEKWRETWKHVVPEFKDALRFKLGNLTLLEKELNGPSSDEVLEGKVVQYKKSKFRLTQELAEETGSYFKGFSSVDPTDVIEKRGKNLGSDLFAKMRTYITKYGKQ